jgi:CRISPR/Cas system-associated exonuclease Cas4 (RecB family)
VIRGWEDELAPAIPRVWKSEIEEIRTDLRGWLRHMATTGNDWIPLQPELEFNDTKVFHGFRLKGRIDLVERHRSNGLLRITDYKTGKPPDKMPGLLGGGAVLQPVLYAMAAEAELGQPVDRGRLFFSTQRGGYREIEVPVNDTSLSRMRVLLNTIHNAVETGFLPAAPNTDACQLCDFRPVCGPYEERRVAAKPKDRLEPLKTVRQL